MKFFNLFRLHQTDNIKTKNINKKRADTKKISEVKKGNEAKRIAEAKKLAEFKKGFDDFTSIISHNPIGDSRVIIESTICQLKNIFANTKNKKIGFVVFATKNYLSSDFIESVKSYAREGIRIVFVIDRTVKNNKSVNDALSQFKLNQCISIFHFSRSISTLERMSIALASLGTEYAVFFTMKDTANRRSLITYLNKVITDSSTPVVLHTSLNLAELRQNFLREPAISALSGGIFKTSFLQSKLKKIEGDWDFWVPHILFNHIEDNDITLINSMRRYWNVNEPSQISIPDLGYLCRDMAKLAHSSVTAHETLRNIINQFSLCLNNIIKSKNFTETKLSYIASGAALLVASLYNVFSKDEYRDILYQCSSIFNFDTILKNENIHKIHANIVKNVIELKNNTVAVVETDFMEDLKTCFVPFLKKEYEVIYISKPQYYDYHFFYCMVMRAIIQPAQYIVTSNDMHRYITSGKTTLTLWHGSGMLKEIASPDRKKYPMDYLVTSSESCVLPWSKQFGVAERNVLPFGQVQTDIMFDKEFAMSTKAQLYKEYNIPNGSKIIFFAPTFRIAKPGAVPSKYYDFQMDIEALSEKLAECGAYLITKRHHVFSHILLDKGIDASGVHPSKNGHFIVDESHNFQELISAADVFITDYSSGLFYAVVRNMPLVLYAPDIEDYKTGPNGFMVKYPEEMAGVFVGKPDIDAFMKAIDDAVDDVSSERYVRFKEKHVAACDGHVAERLMRYLETWDGTQFTNIFAKPEDEILESTEAPLSDEQVQSPEQTNAALLEGGKNA